MRIAIVSLLTVTFLALTPRQTLAAEENSAHTGNAAEQPFKVEQASTRGSVVIGGKRIDYEAVTGTILVHPKGWDDVAANRDVDPKAPEPVASMFYVAYFAKPDPKAPRTTRPVTFFFNGGPGSSTVWLHKIGRAHV